MKNRIKWLCIIFLMGIFSEFAQQKNVSGVVTDFEGLPLPGVNVVVKGTITGLQTDFNGNYQIQANSGDVLVFSYLGLKTVEISVGVSNTIDVQMEQDTQALEEIVVVAYGSQTKEKIVQNVAIVNEETLENLVVNSPDQFLQGQAAGG